MTEAIEPFIWSHISVVKFLILNSIFIHLVAEFSIYSQRLELRYQLWAKADFWFVRRACLKFLYLEVYKVLQHDRT